MVILRLDSKFQFMIFSDSFHSINLPADLLSLYGEVGHMVQTERRLNTRAKS
jgi:hypothetical protein